MPVVPVALHTRHSYIIRPHVQRFPSPTSRRVIADRAHLSAIGPFAINAVRSSIASIVSEELAGGISRLSESIEPSWSAGSPLAPFDKLEPRRTGFNVARLRDPLRIAVN